MALSPAKSLQSESLAIPPISSTDAMPINITVPESSSAISNEPFDSAAKVDFDLADRLFPNRNPVVKRHSIYICNRTPPPKSIAADILSSGSFLIESSRSILTSIEGIQEALSDFNSAKEELIDRADDSSSHEDIDINLRVNLKPKSRRKKKKKLKEISPEKNKSAKKKDTKESPNTVA